jgi:hypothetical protein
VRSSTRSCGAALPDSCATLHSEGTAEEFEHVEGRFADLARDAALTPVRFVKTIDSYPTPVSRDARARRQVGITLGAAMKKSGQRVDTRS